MKYFLKSNGVREEFRSGALSVRCFLLLMNLNKENLSFGDSFGSLDADVKIEPIEILEENVPLSKSESDRESISVSDADSDDLERLAGFAVASFKGNTGKKRPNQSKDVKKSKRIRTRNS